MKIVYKKNKYDGAVYEIWQNDIIYESLIKARRVYSSFLKKDIGVFFHRHQNEFTDLTEIELHKVKLVLSGNDL